jgi:hypothetical protein
MQYVTVEDFIASFLHPTIPMVQGKPDYQTINAIQKLLQTNARAIDTHLGGVALEHLGLIASDTSHAMVAPATPAGTKLWVNPTAPGRAPENMDQGTSAQISAARHVWEKAILTFCTFNTVQQSLKTQFITFFSLCIYTFSMMTWWVLQTSQLGKCWTTFS